MGPLGKASEYDNVKYLTFLPDDAAPIAAFVGLTDSGAGESAVFAISSLVEVGEGDGSCAPHKPAPCQFLTLEAWRAAQPQVRRQDATGSSSATPTSSRSRTRAK